jgi:ABC-type nitrate/sulfonate/bicarbonate transport system substrate-binding protein
VEGPSVPHRPAGAVVVSRRRRGWVRPAGVAAAVLVAGCVATACGTAEESDARPVTLMLNWTPNAHHVGIYAALARGWYDDAGIDLTVVEPADAGVEQAVASGAAQVGLAQAESLLPARAAGVPVVSVATVLPVNDSALFGLASDGIDRPADLAGTRYGGFGGALETEIISALVECDGADPSEVEFVTIGNVDYLAGLQADQFDTAWVFSGWDVLRAEQVEGVDTTQIRFSDWLGCIPNWYTPLVLTSTTLAESDPDLVRDVLAVTARGYALAEDDPAGAAELMLGEVPELDPELVRASVAYYAPRFSDGEWGVQDEQTWLDFAGFLLSAAVVDEPVDAAAAFTNEFLPGG